MPGYEGRSRRGLISLDIERSIAICLWLPATWQAIDRERPISVWQMGGASAGRRRPTARSLPRTAFCRGWSGFRSTAFLSPTGVQGSVLHAASLSPCWPTWTCQGGNEVSPESAGNWCGAHDGSTSTTTMFVCDSIVCDAPSLGAHFMDRERALWSSFLEAHCFKGRCTAENLAAVFPVGCSETLWAVDRPARGVSETYYRNPRWSSQHGCCRQAPWWGIRMGK